MKKILALIILLLAGLLSAGWRLWLQPVGVAETTVAQAASLGVLIPAFHEIPVDHAHVYDGTEALPFAGGAVIDIDGDDRPEIFAAGGAGQEDALLTLRDGRFINIIGTTGLSSRAATYGALSLDLDNDRDVDLIVARADGLHVYKNTGDGRFLGRKVPLDLEPHAAPISITAGDINRDGRADLYISTFVTRQYFTPTAYNDPTRTTRNILLLGKKDGSFEDATVATGAMVRRNTFAALFVDMDNDGWQDLAVAPAAGRALVFRNKGDGAFDPATPITDFGFWTSLTAADYDGDGDSDLFLSNIGNTVPPSLLTGDLRPDQPLDLEWALLRNDGTLRFSRVEASGMSGFEFAWGGAVADFNLDGRPDLAVAENYVSWPAHWWDRAAGRLLLQSATGKFVPITRIAGVENRHYGQATLTGDFNGDNRPDLIYLNLDGAPRAFLGRASVNQPLVVRLADNVRALGARVMVRRPDGRVLSAQASAGGGFLGDPASEMIFGLGPGKAPVTVEIVWPNGRRKKYSRVKPGQTLKVN